LYAFELCRQVWRHSQSPAVPLSESAFSSGEEPSSFVVTCTRGFMPLCAAAGIEPVRLNALSLPMDKSRGFPRDLVTKTKRSRHNVYQLREKISITDGEGRAIARASWDYIPSLVQAAVADVRQVLLSGDLAGAKVVHIEHLHIQVNVNEVQPGGVANNLQVTMAEALNTVKDPSLRAQLARMTGNLLVEDAPKDDT